MTNPIFATAFDAPPNFLATLKGSGGNSVTMFPVQSTSWLALQTAMLKCYELPATTDEFTAKYGEFSDTAKVEAIVATIAKIKVLSQKFGNPSLLIKELSNFQNNALPPASLYGHAIWLSNKIQTESANVASTLKSLTPFLQSASTDTEKKQDISQTYTEFMAPAAKNLHLWCDTFTEDLGNFLATFHSLVSDTNQPESLASLLAQKDNILLDAQNALADDADQITEITDDIKSDEARYKKYCLLAETSPAYLLVPFVGIGVAIGMAAAFATKAVQEKHAIEALQSRLSLEVADKRKKAALVMDLHQFMNDATAIATDANTFSGQLTKMASGFHDLAVNIEAANDGLGNAILRDWSAFIESLRLEAAATNWSNIEAYSEKFALTGFATFSASSA